MGIQGLKNKILQLAIKGKLVNQDPNDEPASVLLQRIKEEKEGLIKEGKIKKEKPLPEITEEEKPFDIPESWEWVRLGEVGLTQTGTTPSTKHPEYFNGTIPFIKPADISEKGIDYNNESLTELGLLKGRLIEKNSVLMVCIGGSIGKCYFTNRDVSCNQQINTITPYKAVSNKILYYFMISDFFYNSVLKSATGTATPIINKSKWDMLLIPLPPLAEQKRIVEKVDELFTLIDELDSNKKDLLEVINLTRNQVLQEAIQGKLVEQNPEDEPASVLIQRIKEERDKLVKEGKIRKEKQLPDITEEEKPFEIREGWEWVRLGSISKIISKGTTPRGGSNAYVEKGIKFLRVENLSKDYKIDLSKVKFIDKSIHEDELKRSIGEKNDLLISIAGTLGRVAILREEYLPCNMNQAISFVRTFYEYVNVDYLKYAISSAGMQKIMISKTKTTAQPNLTLEIVSNLIVPLPPLAEQKRIVEKVDIIMNMLDELEKTIME